MESRRIDLTKLSSNNTQLIYKPLDRFIDVSVFESSHSISNRITSLLAIFSGFERGVKDLLASLEEFSLRQPHKLLELPPFTRGFSAMVCNSGLAEKISLTQSLVDSEDQSEEHTEAYRPFLVAGCAFVAGPHQATPCLENLHDPLSLNFEECEFDLPLDASRGRSWRIFHVEIVLDCIL